MTTEEKRRRAISFLGDRYVLHPSNQVKRNPNRTPDVMRVDVAKTIKRARERGLDLV